MHAIRIKRNIKKGKRIEESTNLRSVLRFARKFFANENNWDFIIEAFVFGALFALSAWPIITAAGAIERVL
jgi:hypothetical protein